MYRINWCINYLACILLILFVMLIEHFYCMDALNNVGDRVYFAIQSVQRESGNREIRKHHLLAYEIKVLVLVGNVAGFL